MRHAPQRLGDPVPRPFSVRIGLLGTIALTLALAHPAAADTIKVTSTHNSGPGSLHAAIDRANHLPGFDKLAVKVTGTIVERTALPNLETDLAIEGPGAHKLTVKRLGKGYPVFTVAPSAASVRVSRISIIGGLSGIFNYGGLTVTRSTVGDADFRGILNKGSLAVSRSTVRGCVIGIHNKGTAAISRTTVRGNDYGLGNEGRLMVSRSTVRDSKWRDISNFASLTVSQSTVSDDSTSVFAIYNDFRSSLAVSQSTVSGSFYRDGAIVNNGTATFQSTIIANSSGSTCTRPVSSLGHNLASDGSCSLTAQGDQPNTDPLLRPLANYGGPTKTFALPPSSPAVNAGFADGAKTDQRGLGRIVDYPGVPRAVGGDNSDIGSFELQLH